MDKEKLEQIVGTEQLKEMPSKDVLERFLIGLGGGPITVVFDMEKGVFIDYLAKDK